MSRECRERLPRYRAVVHAGVANQQFTLKPAVGENVTGIHFLHFLCALFALKYMSSYNLKHWRQLSKSFLGFVDNWQSWEIMPFHDLYCILVIDVVQLLHTYFAYTRLQKDYHMWFSIWP